MTVKELVIKLCREKSLTEIAYRCGISEQSIRYWRGKDYQDIKFRHVKTMCEMANVNISDIEPGGD